MDPYQIRSVEEGDFTDIIKPFEDFLSTLRVLQKKVGDTLKVARSTSGKSDLVASEIIKIQKTLKDDPDFILKKGKPPGRLYGKDLGIKHDLKSMAEFINEIQKIPNKLLEKVLNPLDRIIQDFVRELANYTAKAKKIEEELKKTTKPKKGRRVQSPQGVPNF